MLVENPKRLADFYTFGREKNAPSRVFTKFILRKERNTRIFLHSNKEPLSLLHPEASARTKIFPVREQRHNTNSKKQTNYENEVL